jgi:hypothetical protein
MGTEFLSQGKASGEEVKQRVQLNIYSFSGLLWPVLGQALQFERYLIRSHVKRLHFQAICRIKGTVEIHMII